MCSGARLGEVVGAEGIEEGAGAHVEPAGAARLELLERVGLEVGGAVVAQEAAHEAVVVEVVVLQRVALMMWADFVVMLYGLNCADETNKVTPNTQSVQSADVLGHGQRVHSQLGTCRDDLTSM